MSRNFSKEEIANIQSLYRGAKNKQREVGILAEMHLCEKEDIRKVLGLDIPGKKPEKSPDIAPTRCQPGKAVDVWEESTDGILKNALEAMLEEFDRNEAEMKKIMQQMIPLSVDYKKYEARQRRLAQFIEDYCRLNTNKAD